jgi:hypothetical protein
VVPVAAVANACTVSATDNNRGGRSPTAESAAWGGRAPPIPAWQAAQWYGTGRGGWYGTGLLWGC